MFRKPEALNNIKYVTHIPPGCAFLIDDMVGTTYGETRSEVLRFIVINWTTEHIENIRRARRARNEFDRKRKNGQIKK